jgi:hypothetical protein
VDGGGHDADGAVEAGHGTDGEDVLHGVAQTGGQRGSDRGDGEVLDGEVAGGAVGESAGGSAAKGVGESAAGRRGVDGDGEAPLP